MKSKLLSTFGLLFLMNYSANAQVPQGFNYQAVARDGSGNLISNQQVFIKVSILSDTTGFKASGTGIYLWEEQHSVTTNSFGLFNLVIGTQTKIQGTASGFSLIDWNAGQRFIGIKLQYQTQPWRNMGTARLNAVPYALVSNGVANGSKLSVVSGNDASGEALFEVKRKDGQTVFAVYPDAVNVYVPRSTSKGSKGGFAIGGFGDGSKANLLPQDYFRVTPDSVRIYIDPTPVISKGSKGGFAIGSYGEQTKGGINNMYFNLTGATSVNTVNESPQILWYPAKKAFLAGSIHIGSVDSVGQNSTALGYRSIAMGNYSQAFGYKAKAFGQYSTSIGKNSIAGSSTANNAFAFGDNAEASGNSSIAFGNGSLASGLSSIAIGNNTTASNTFSTAIGYFSQSTGVKSISIGANYTKSIYIKPLNLIIRPIIVFPKSGEPSDPNQIQLSGGGTKGGYINLPSFINRNNIAEGEYSLAIGNGNYASNGGSAFGVYNDASAQFATSIGFGNQATAVNSFAAGYANLAEGEFSAAFGRYTNATSENSFVIGRYNVSTGTTTNWVETEPLFQIGNGSSSTYTHDAFRVLKNGGTYVNASNAYAGLWVINSNTSDNPNSTYSLGIMSGVQRNKAGLTYYSGYFYDAGGGQGTYNGLWADKRTGSAIDVAEYIYDSDANTEPADVVVADPYKKESVLKSSKPYQSSVVGVISTKPHMIMGMELVIDEKTGESLTNAKPATRLALTGRVPVKVTNENGTIVPGDYLTTSSIAGTAMKWTLLDINAAKDFDDLKRILSENEKRRNAIIGKAVESFSGSTGKVMILISLQ